ncbi:MAG TPA: bifunctional diaminohydroxyphosphoribosylaminopyrimidine deaminase/5-amino-6-(5-phosphoribosylamino)uracil reductase RibD [Candidatus Acidoferrales bacterium]|nr:bifunctional diaminohydroxyphosphoribosylaminopyrimidine deaminase/5-amino-6-(5-phosphoribosylamino)uracil reductase RibD [Candidatus Acidoferrales bacterium]
MSIPSSTSDADDIFMTRALALATHGVALAHPNPVVGALLVKSGQIVGQGYHDYERRDHAEIVALKQAGTKARGATLYVTLEPCCTTGRTGPCTKAIISGGVKRVVAAMQDPNPAVAGRGFAQLRRAGIRVTIGVREEDAQRWNEDFAWWIRTRRPFVTLKTALTLDGQIAQRAGSVTWITSERSREAVHGLRHEADALLTGIGTVLADNPRMSDRTGKPRRRRLLRAIVDSRLRTPLRSKLVKSADGDVVVFTTQRADSPQARALVRAGVEVFQVRAQGGHVDLRAVVRELGRRQMLNVLLEAGAELNGAALQAGIVDKMILFYAPKIMGTGGVPMARIPSRWFAKSPALKNISVQTYGPDFVVQGYFHDVYRNHRTRRKN